MSENQGEKDPGSQKYSKTHTMRKQLKTKQNKTNIKKTVSQGSML